MARRVLIGSGAVLVAAAIAWLMFVGLRGARRPAASARAVAAPAPATPSPPGRKIKVRLFYVTDDGMRLTSVERDIAYGEGPIEQAREIVAAQIAPVSEPLLEAAPADHVATLNTSAAARWKPSGRPAAVNVSAISSISPTQRQAL